LSNRHLKQLSREITAAQPNVGNCLMKWSTCKIGFNEEDHLASTRGVGTIPLLCTPTINNITVNRTLIDGGAGLNIISARSLRRCRCHTTGLCQLDHSSGNRRVYNTNWAGTPAHYL
jgi:hypothetical protein